MKDRSLIFFTLVMQAAVGIFLAAQFLHLLYAFLPQPSQGQDLSIVPLSIGLKGASFLLACLGMLASLTHLGTPRSAWRAIRNLPGSWLSREIAFGLLFTGFVGLTLLAYLFPSRLFATLVTAQLSALLCGFLHLYSMARVYMQRTIPSWNTPHTWIAFFLTAAIAGLLSGALGGSLLAGSGHPWVQAVLRILAVGAALALASQALNHAFLHLRPQPANPIHPGQRQIRSVPGRLPHLLVAGWLLAAGFALLPIWMPGLGRLCFMLSLCLACASEILARSLLYASYTRTGL